MGIQVVWDNHARTAICYQVDGRWTWVDMNAAIVTSNAMLDEVSHKVDFIYDMTTSAGIPNGVLSNLGRYIGKEHPNTGQQLIVGTTKSGVMLFTQGLLNMVYKLYKPRWGITFADTMDQARQALSKNPTPQN